MFGNNPYVTMTATKLHPGKVIIGTKMADLVIKTSKHYEKLPMHYT